MHVLGEQLHDTDSSTLPFDPNKLADMTGELPPNWVDTNIVKFRDDPYSNEALAVPQQDMIDLGPIDMAALPEAPGAARFIKTPGKNFEQTDADLPYLGAHQLFLGAAKNILGTERFHSASVKFSARAYSLSEGRLLSVGIPHIDGQFPIEEIESPILALMGIACNDMPTKIVQGGYARDRFYRDVAGLPESDRANSTWFYSVADKNIALDAEPIPINRLIVVGPVAVHFGEKADHKIPMRHLQRWSVYLQ